MHIESTYKVKVELLQNNFLKENDFDRIFEDFKNKNITIEVLVNCASDFIPSSFNEQGSELFHKEMTINLKTPYLLPNAFVRAFVN